MELTEVIGEEEIPEDVSYQHWQSKEHYSLWVHSQRPWEHVDSQEYSSWAREWSRYESSSSPQTKEEYDRDKAWETWFEVVIARLESFKEENGEYPDGLAKILNPEDLQELVTYERTAPDEYILEWFCFMIGPPSDPSKSTRSAMIYRSSTGEWE